jgi:hypothetical protein
MTDQARNMVLERGARPRRLTFLAECDVIESIAGAFDKMRAFPDFPDKITEGLGKNIKERITTNL